MRTRVDRGGGSVGFTLVEMIVVVSIVAIAAGVVVPAVANVTRAELRSTAGRLCGTVRASYDSAALTGRPYRVAFDFEKQVIRVEEGQEPRRGGGSLSGIAAMLAGGATGLDAGSEAALEVQAPAEILALFGVTASDASPDAGGLASFSGAGHDLELDEDIKLMDVWIEGMSQPINEGVAYLRFFPHGYTENALVHLTSTEGDVLTVRVKALTGKTEILDSYVEPGKR